MPKKRLSGIDSNYCTDKSHRVLRYELKIGNLEEAVHIFHDLLHMTIFNHEEFDDGSADGSNAHNQGNWSHTILGYGISEADGVCIQLTFNHGIERYERGNTLQAVQIQLTDTSRLEEAGFHEETRRGHHMYFLTCDDYNIEVIKSPLGSSRISRIVLNCINQLNLSGPTISFWTKCLKFKVVGCSTELGSDGFIRSILCRCCCSISRKYKVHPEKLENGDQPYVDLQYGSSAIFIRLQKLPKGVALKTGAGRERLLLTSTRGNLDAIMNDLQVLSGLHGGSEKKKSFQLAPGQTNLIPGLVATDPNGAEVCFYAEEDVRSLTQSQVDSEAYLRACIDAYKKKMTERMKRGR